MFTFSRDPPVYLLMKYSMIKNGEANTVVYWRAGDDKTKSYLR